VDGLVETQKPYADEAKVKYDSRDSQGSVGELHVQRLYPAGQPDTLKWAKVVVVVTWEMSGSDTTVSWCFSESCSSFGRNSGSAIRFFEVRDERKRQYS